MLISYKNQYKYAYISINPAVLVVLEEDFIIIPNLFLEVLFLTTSY